MSETIGVTYLQVYVAGVLSYHLALFYQDDAGNKRVIEAAPEHNEDLSFEQKAEEVLKEGWSLQNKNNGSPFGLIVGGIDRGTMVHRILTARDRKKY